MAIIPLVVVKIGSKNLNAYLSNNGYRSSIYGTLFYFSGYKTSLWKKMVSYIFQVRSSQSSLSSSETETIPTNPSKSLMHIISLSVSQFKILPKVKCQLAKHQPAQLFSCKNGNKAFIDTKESGWHHDKRYQICITNISTANHIYTLNNSNPDHALNLKVTKSKP